MRLYLQMIKASLIAVFLFTGSTSKAQIKCNSDTFAFYGIGNTFGNSSYSAVYELKITSGGVVVDTANEILAPPGVNLQGLAIANLGSGQRFYSMRETYTLNNVFRRELYMYNGSTWSVIYTDSTTTFPTGNAAGNGNYLYYHNSRFSGTGFNWPGAIQRFTGSGFVTLLLDSNQNTNYPVADIAVDDSGNVYYFTGDDTVNRAKVTRLNVMSPTGILLDTIPVSLNTFGLYGCFFQNNVLWVCCLGNATIPYPYMTPITIQGNTASVGSPVAIPKPALGYVTGPNSTTTIYLTFNDVASCSNTQIFAPDGINAVSTNHDYHIYPNPAVNVFSVEMPTSANRSLTIYNSMGQLCYTTDITGKNWVVDCSKFNKGLYLIKISSATEEYTSRIIIE